MLLVEDEPGTLNTTAMLLEMSGFRVSKAPNGRRGLDMLLSERPDLLVTDYMMPHMDGLQLIAAVRAEPTLEGLPILLMSAALPAEAARQQVADGFISKPFDYDEFERRVRALLGG
ncbi:response regulator [Solimonas sp. C16B3]|uniref:Response regulator n=1 Tax=Solimonas marina TaxID=2714601 RepID=A0A969WCQ6_9GAMM|nr:response regulator [Solimonas marina]